jgi:hypothetical protein
VLLIILSGEVERGRERETERERETKRETKRGGCVKTRQRTGWDH